MPEIGVPELLIVAFIVVLLFGPSKAGDLGGSLGKSIRAFRQASREDDPAPTPPAVVASLPQSAVACLTCGTPMQASQKFCTTCGNAIQEAASV